MPRVDLSKYAGREQAYVKHCLLEDYLSKWSYIVGNSSWDSLVYVDGFVGPWGTSDENFEDASFGIAVRVLNNAVDGLWETHGKSVRGLCVFVEKKPDAFAQLEAFANSRTTDRVRAVAMQGRFVQNIAAIEGQISLVGNNPFKFVFLDQKGWAATPMNSLRPFLRNRSCEVLFNLMTSFLTRFVEAEGREASYDALFGRPGVLEKIRALPKGTGEREEAAVREYCKSLRDVCGFQYISQAVIVDPNKEKVRYYLIFATNSPRGVEVFKGAEIVAADVQNDVRYEASVKKTGQPDLFAEISCPKSRLIYELRHRYLRLAQEKIIGILSTVSRGECVTYGDLFCEAMAFPLVTPDDLVGMLGALVPRIEFRLEGERRKKPVALIKEKGLFGYQTQARAPGTAT